MPLICHIGLHGFGRKRGIPFHVVGLAAFARRELFAPWRRKALERTDPLLGLRAIKRLQRPASL